MACTSKTSCPHSTPEVRSRGRRCTTTRSMSAWSSPLTRRADGLVELNDDRRLQPAENVTPVVRAEVVDALGPEAGRPHRRGVGPPDDRRAAPTECRGRRRGEQADRGRELAGRAGRDRMTDERASAATRASAGLANAETTAGSAGTFVPPTVRRTPQRRRPTGSPPPLPRDLGASGKGWLAILAVLLVWIVAALAFPSVRRATNQVDAALLRARAPGCGPTGWSSIAESGQPRRGRMDGQCDRCVAHRGARRVPALAAPLHVPRQPPRARDRRWEAALRARSRGRARTTSRSSDVGAVTRSRPRPSPS